MFYWCLIFLSAAGLAGFLGFLNGQGLIAETGKVLFFLFVTMFACLAAVGIERRFFSQRAGQQRAYTDAEII